MAMNIDVCWYNGDTRVILIEIGRNWTWDEFYGMMVYVKALRHEVDHPIGYLVHAPHTHELPPGMSVTRLKKVVTLGEDERFIILVGTSLFVQMMIASIMSLLGMDQRRRLHFAATMAEAQPILDTQLAALQEENTVRSPAHSA